MMFNSVNEKIINVNKTPFFAIKRTHQTSIIKTPTKQPIIRTHQTPIIKTPTKQPIIKTPTKHGG